MRLGLLFAPPYRALRWGLFLLLVTAFAYAPEGATHTFRLPGAEDYWALDKALALGSGSEGLSQLANRIDGGKAGALSAQITDYPLMGLAELLSSVLETRNAAILASLALPLLKLAFLMGLLPWLATGLLPKGQRQLTALYLPFMPALVEAYAPGHVAGAGWALLLVALVQAGLMRAMLGVARWRSLAVVGAATLLLVCIEPAPRDLVAPTFDLWLFARQMILPCVAGLFVLFQLLQGGRRGPWLLAAVFLFPTLGLAFLEDKFFAYAQLFSLAPLTVLLLTLWGCLRSWPEGRPRYTAELSLFLALTVLPVAVIPAVAKPTPLVPDLLLFPVHAPSPPCNMLMAAEQLEATWGFGDQTRRILVPGEGGPELLFRSRHDVVGVPELGGEALQAFLVKDEEAGAAFLRETGADMLLVCRKKPQILPGTLLDKLLKGQIPPYLKRIEIMFDADYLLFDVQKPLLGEG